MPPIQAKFPPTQYKIYAHLRRVTKYPKYAFSYNKDNKKSVLLNTFRSVILKR